MHTYITYASLFSLMTNVPKNDMISIIKLVKRRKMDEDEDEDEEDASSFPC